MELICFRFCTHFFFEFQAVSLTLFAIGSYHFYILVGGMSMSMSSKTTVGITVVIFYIKGFKRILDNFDVLNLIRPHQISVNWVQ